MTAKTIFCGILLAACAPLAATAAEPIDAVIAQDFKVATAQYRVLLDKAASPTWASPGRAATRSVSAASANR